MTLTITRGSLLVGTLQRPVYEVTTAVIHLATFLLPSVLSRPNWKNFEIFSPLSQTHFSLLSFLPEKWVLFRYAVALSKFFFFFLAYVYGNYVVFLIHKRIVNLFVLIYCL